MADKTEQKIIDSSLKIFAEKGYAGATTRNLAEEAGFSEMTLFRKFKTKQNLFDTVLIQNKEKFMNDIESVIKIEEFESPEDFLRFFMKNIIDIIDKNFDFISIIVQGDSKLFPTMKGSNEFLFSNLGGYLEGLDIFEKSDMNNMFFVFNTITFSYFITLDKHRGQNSVNGEKLVEEFINHYTK